VDQPPLRLPRLLRYRGAEELAETPRRREQLKLMCGFGSFSRTDLVQAPFQTMRSREANERFMKTRIWRCGKRYH
jgi:hypothetical protein